MYRGRRSDAHASSLCPRLLSPSPSGILLRYHSSLFSEYDFEEWRGRAFAGGEEARPVEAVADGFALTARAERDEGGLLSPDVVEALRAFGERQFVAARVVAERDAAAVGGDVRAGHERAEEAGAAEHRDARERVQCQRVEGGRELVDARRVRALRDDVEVAGRGVYEQRLAVVRAVGVLDSDCFGRGGRARAIGCGGGVRLCDFGLGEAVDDYGVALLVVVSNVARVEVRAGGFGAGASGDVL